MSVVLAMKSTRVELSGIIKWLGVIALLLLRMGYAFPADENRDRSLNFRLYGYKEEIRKYVPYLPSLDPKENNLILPLVRFEFPGTRIKIRMPFDSYLFVNGQYTSTETGETIRIMDVDSLFRLFPGDSVILGFYLPRHNARLLKIILEPKENSEAFGDPGSDLLRARQMDSGFKEFLIISWIVILGYISFLANYDGRLFRQYLNLLKIFSDPDSDDLLDRSKPVAGTDLLFVILESVVFGFFIYLIIYSGHHDLAFEPFRFLPGISYWLALSLIILGWIVIKFNLVRNLSHLLQIRDIGKMHFLESSRISLTVLLGYFVLSWIMIFGFKSNLNLYIPFLIKSLVFFAFLRFFVILIKILNYAPYKKIYIIAYLCASELIPVVLGLKLIIDSSRFS